MTSALALEGDVSTACGTGFLVADCDGAVEDGPVGSFGVAAAELVAEVSHATIGDSFGGDEFSDAFFWGSGPVWWHQAFLNSRRIVRSTYLIALPSRRQA